MIAGAHLQEAERLDRADPFASYRAAFALPASVIYLDGNSLGPPPRRALARLETAARRAWADGLIRSWNGHDGADGWIDLPTRAGAKIAALIGARPDDVIVADSVSINIFKLAGALLKAAPRKALAVEADEFPTDAYMLDGLARLAGAPLVRLAPGEALAAKNVGVLVKSLVHYKSAAVADMAAVERDAAAAGAAVIWDLSHATGVVAIDVAASGARYAVGCGYKYLNGGPGAPAFLYCERGAAARLEQPLSGWMGHARPFAFAPRYEPATGAARFLAGTPPILSMAALDAALSLFEGVDIGALEAKARALGDIFTAHAQAGGLAPAFPVGRRGAHIVIPHPDGYAIVQALIARGVIGDFREPDLMRFGFSPLFLSYAEVSKAAETLVEVVRSGEWRDPRFARRAAVT